MDKIKDILTISRYRCIENSLEVMSILSGWGGIRCTISNLNNVEVIEFIHKWSSKWSLMGQHDTDTYIYR